MSQDRMVTVQLIGYPLRIYALAQEHADDLLREFALLSMTEGEGEPGGHTTPRRLLELVEDLTGRYAERAQQPDAVRDAALERGEESLDLSYPVPLEARADIARLGEMMDEADEYCRSGEHLLTLATPPEARVFRDWYLGEFLAQLDGRPPTSWPEYRAAHSAG